jgi:hypothetical protein
MVISASTYSRSSLPENVLYVFVHVQKTAGTSFMQQIIRANFTPEQILEGVTIRTFRKRLRPEHRFATGHVAYGLHWLTQRPVVYLTFLRHPVDRALSHYFFIRQCDPRFCRHDRYEAAISMDLLSFYTQPRFRNEMTMMLAGIPWHKLQGYVTHAAFGQWALRRACFNLRYRFACFGLQEHFEDSLQLFARTFGWQVQHQDIRLKQTRLRPKLEEISPEMYQQLARLNYLDMLLYRYARRLFVWRMHQGFI